MLAYSTTNMPEDGPILSNPDGTGSILLVDVALSCLKGTTHWRSSKLATSKMDLASTATSMVHRS